MKEKPNLSCKRGNKDWVGKKMEGWEEGTHDPFHPFINAFLRGHYLIVRDGRRILSNLARPVYFSAKERKLGMSNEAKSDPPVTKRGSLVFLAFGIEFRDGGVVRIFLQEPPGI